MLQRKKGIALNQAFGAVLTLVLVAVLVIIAIIMFVSLNTAFAGTLAVGVVNESVSPNTPGVPLSGASNCSSAGFAIGIVINDTGQVITSANYSVVSDTGIFTNLTDEFAATPLWNVSYTYTWGSEACDAGDDLITQFGTYPTLVGLVGTIIFLGLVIGVLVSSFVFGRKDAI